MELSRRDPSINGSLGVRVFRVVEEVGVKTRPVGGGGGLSSSVLYTMPPVGGPTVPPLPFWFLRLETIFVETNVTAATKESPFLCQKD